MMLGKTYAAVALDEAAETLRHVVPVVFDMEETPPRPLGVYRYTEEDTIVFVDAYGFRKLAPYDCVKVIQVDTRKRA